MKQLNESEVLLEISSTEMLKHVFSSHKPKRTNKNKNNTDLIAPLC